MFEIGDKIVYSKSGVCEITDICDGPYGLEGLCYKMKPYDDEEDQSTIYIQVDNDRVFMRKVMSNEKAKEILDNLNNYPAVFPRNEKERTELIRETLQSDDMTIWIQLLKGLCQEKRKRLRLKKDLKYRDERIFKFLENLIFGELSIALDVPKEKVFDYVVKEFDMEFSDGYNYAESFVPLEPKESVQEELQSESTDTDNAADTDIEDEKTGE